jgi:hypothetical protein
VIIWNKCLLVALSRKMSKGYEERKSFSRQRTRTIKLHAFRPTVLDVQELSNTLLLRTQKSANKDPVLHRFYRQCGYGGEEENA